MVNVMYSRFKYHLSCLHPSIPRIRDFKSLAAVGLVDTFYIWDSILFSGNEEFKILRFCRAGCHILNHSNNTNVKKMWH
jgi:hypothetical protein